MAAERVIRIYDEVAASYDQVGPPFYALVGTELVTRTGLHPGDQVLDAGCGRGACLFPAAAAVAPHGHVHAIDISPQMVTETSAEATRRHTPNTTIQQGNAEHPDFPAASFDAVLSGFVLRMLPDPAAALHTYARLLRPGGRLGATIYAMSWDPRWHDVAATLDSFTPTTPPSPTLLDPPARLAALLQAAGFQDITITDEPFNTTFTDPGQWWSYLWSSGYRSAVDRIPAHQRDQARQAALAATDPLRTPEGHLIMPQHVRLTTATRI